MTVRFLVTNNFLLSYIVDNGLRSKWVIKEYSLSSIVKNLAKKKFIGDEKKKR